MDTLPVEILARIYCFCNLETAVALSQTNRATWSTWCDLDVSLAQPLVLERVPWFTLNESGTGLTTWTRCALAIVSRTRATKNSFRGWSAIKEGAVREQIRVPEDSRLKEPVKEKSLIKPRILYGTDVIPEKSPRETKVRHSDPSISVTFLEENDVFLHFADTHDMSEHQIANKSLCTQDEDGTWVVSNKEFLWDFIQVTLLPNGAGAFFMSYRFHEDAHIGINTPLCVQVYHVPSSAVPASSLDSLEWQDVATRIGPKMYLELGDSYYYHTTVSFGMIYNGFFYAMVQSGLWLRLWIDLEATDAEGDFVLAVNSNFPAIRCSKMNPQMSTHVRGNKISGLDRYFVLPYQKLSWIGDLLTGVSYCGETFKQSLEDHSYQMAPFFARDDMNSPGFYKWPVSN
ncbi:YALIA101S04e05182g1_1 [Yarrowia lipolytica]|nr:YALIA101S04e05182g1_1 [Yarrowia lipolytica]VBB89199.1 Hypothetical protein of a 30-member gene family, conserved in the Yarrowia clade [Yarrowia lipolytica]